MTKCGYSMTVDYLADVTNAREDPESPTGFSFDTNALAERYQRMGLEVTRSDGDRGSVRAGKCKICREWNTKTTPTGTRAVHCDPEAHSAYYDALERMA